MNNKESKLLDKNNAERKEKKNLSDSFKKYLNGPTKSNSSDVLKYVRG